MQRTDHEQRLETYLERYFPEFETGGQIWTRLVKAAIRPGMRILDAGAGENGLLYKAVGASAVQRLGLDIMPLPAHHPAEHLVQANLEAIPAPAASFDMVTSEFVVEHLQDPAAVLREIWRVLKPGGQCIVLTSNVYNPIMASSKLTPHHIHVLLRERLLAQAAHETFPTTYRANTLGALRQLGQAAGFAETRVYRAGNPGYFTFSRLLLRGAIMAEKLIDRPGLEWLKMYLVGHFVKGGPAHAAPGSGKQPDSSKS